MSVMADSQYGVYNHLVLKQKKKKKKTQVIRASSQAIIRTDVSQIIKASLTQDVWATAHLVTL